jgi:hypothetical protein
MKKLVTVLVALSSTAIMFIGVAARPSAATTTSWSVATSPDRLTPTSDTLIGMSCSSSTSCMAVGSESNDGLSQTLVESLDGTAWKVVPSPNEGDNANYLDSVSCSSATQCVAVGYDINDFNSDQALILVWNGASWSTMTDPVTNLGETELTGVSCTSTAACMAVGNALSDGSYQTLVESWNGNEWTVDSSPNVGSSGSYLNSVSCLSGDHCTAVGSYVDVANGDFNEGLIETWNGMAWTLAPTTPSRVSRSLLKFGGGHIGFRLLPDRT